MNTTQLQNVLTQHAEWLESGGTSGSRANLSGANLSSAIGLFSAIDWLAEHFKYTADGLIAYKSFGAHYAPDDMWVIEPGGVLSENVNPNPTEKRGCGINVATLGWVRRETSGPIWKCLIRWPWLAGVVVPYSTDGKFRAARVELVEIVEGEQ